MTWSNGDEYIFFKKFFTKFNFWMLFFIWINDIWMNIKTICLLRNDLMIWFEYFCLDRWIILPLTFILYRSIGAEQCPMAMFLSFEPFPLVPTLIRVVKYTIAMFTIIYKLSFISKPIWFIVLIVSSFFSFPKVFALALSFIIWRYLRFGSSTTPLKLSTVALGTRL